jgi:hypothetical protein
MSLAHLERQTGQSLVGLIGYGIFKDYELTFDYKRNILTGVHADSSAATELRAKNYGKLLAKVPFEMAMHIPVFIARIGNREFRVGLDCGASANLLLAKYTPDLKGLITDLSASDITGAIKSHVAGQSGIIKEVEIGPVLYRRMLFAFDDATLSALNSAYRLNIDGLLGYQFLKEHTTAIDFRHKEIRVYE